MNLHIDIHVVKSVQYYLAGLGHDLDNGYVFRLLNDLNDDDWDNDPAVIAKRSARRLKKNSGMDWVYDDGGREKAGFKGSTRDCVVRSIAIATEIPYNIIYDQIDDLSTLLSKRKRRGDYGRSRTGVDRKVYQLYLEQQLGWHWVPTMQIGKGCQVHLRSDELPSGRLIVRLSKHVTAVVDRVIHDTWNPSRHGTRCVYGYFHQK